MTLKWTKKAPVQAGWYWIKDAGPLYPKRSRIVEVRIIQDVRGRVVERRGCGDSLWVESHNFEWAGPIPRPEEEA